MGTGNTCPARKSIPYEGSSDPARPCQNLRVDSPVSPFGQELKRWRLRRAETQLGLANRAGSTARHISFLETGRSRPSAEMVHRLSEALDVPEPDRPALLRAAGLPSIAESPPLAAASDALTFAAQAMAESHDPQPAFVFDQAWNVLHANTVGRVLLGDEQNLVRALFSPKWREAITNWETVAWAALRRLHETEDTMGITGEGHEVVEFAERSLRGTSKPESEGDTNAVSPIFVLGGVEVPTVSVIAQFGSLPSTGHLQVELIFAVDDRGRELFAALADARPSPDVAEERQRSSSR